ncbi:C40 family peptidase [Brevibacterium daeguense]|uniref:C40 family peptidase n=1 Tax=Brevibacterium daeguense TaxID=909936 RepID=A0ABP8EJN1_9MICO|nr:C40 family peptidase [Brevibacterium daeguense]
MSARTPILRGISSAVLGVGLLAGASVSAHAVPGLTGGAADRTPTAIPTAKPGEGLEAGDTAFVDVAVATLWTKPSSPRSVDEPALGNPVHLGSWNSNLAGTEVRRGLTGKTQTQALFADEVRILDVDGDWARVAVAGQSAPGEKHGYPGWVPTRQLVENPGFDTARDSRPTAVVTAKTTELSAHPGGEAVEQVTMNTELPMLAEAGDEVRVALPDGSKAWAVAEDVAVHAPGEGPAAPKPSQLVATAEQFLDLRYLWAGTSAYGFDCSGFTYTVFRAHGIEIPRDSGPQSQGGASVAAEDLAVGDLIFFAGTGGRGTVHHVGMYIGHGKMIHAPNASKSVEIVDWKKWDRGKQFAGAQRYL